MNDKSTLSSVSSYLSDAKQSLKGSLFYLIGVYVILALVTVLLTFIHPVLGIISTFITVLFEYGITRYAISIAKDKSTASLNEILSWRYCIGRIIIFNILLVLIGIVIGIIYGILLILGTLILPGILGGIYAIVMIICGILLIGAWLFMSLFILAGDDDVSAWEAISLSFTMGNKYRGKLICFLLFQAGLVILISIIGLFLVWIPAVQSIVTGLLTLILGIYFTVATAHLYIDITKPLNTPPYQEGDFKEFS